MDIIRMITLFCLCIGLPIGWGFAFWHVVSRFSRVKGEIGKDNTCKCALGYGWILYLSGFGLLVLLARRKGWSIDRISVGGILLAIMLTAFFLVLLLQKDFRKRLLLEGFLPCKAVFQKKHLPLLIVTLLGICSISGLYILEGMRLETYHTMPEDVSLILGTRFLIPKSNLAVLYAFLANVGKLRQEQVLFLVIPFAWFVLSAALFFALQTIFFEDTKSRVVCMGVYFLLLLFGDQSHMGLPYMLLHAPYEKGAFIGGVVLLYVALCFMQIQKNLPKIIQTILTAGLGIFCMVVL